MAMSLAVKRHVSTLLKNFLISTKYRSMSVSVASKRISVCGEGPHWDERTQALYYVDIFAGDCCKMNPETGVTDAKNFEGKTVTSVFPYSSDPLQVLVGVGKQFMKLDWRSGQSENLLTMESDLPGNMLNDGKCDPKGRLWIGTLSMELTPENEIKCNEGEGSIYSIDNSYKVTQHQKGLHLPNGMTWSPDYKTFFHVDSHPRKIYAYDFDLTAGKITSSPRLLVDFRNNEEYAECGMPDGITIDAEGKLWVACFDASRVIRIDTETGRLLKTVLFPVQRITSCCFGGKNYEDLYVTTTLFGLTEEQKKQQPDAGKVFKVTGLGVKGIPMNNFGG